MGTEIRSICHLNDKQHIGFIPFCHRPTQTLQMFCTPLGRGIGEGAHPVHFQSHTLDLQKTGPAVSGKGEVEPGVAVEGLWAEVLYFTQSAGSQPFSGSHVGRLGIHVHETLSLPHADQIKPGLPAGICCPLTKNGRAGDQQLPASAGVLHMDGFLPPIYFHLCNKPIGPGQKRPGHHVLIDHSLPIVPRLTGEVDTQPLEDFFVYAA